MFDNDVPTKPVLPPLALAQQQLQPMADDDLVPVDDYRRNRQLIFDKALQAAQEAFPVKNDRYTLRVNNLGYSGPETYSKAEHTQAVLHGRTLSRKLTGNYEMVDNATGAVVSASGKKTIMNVPYLTDYGTFVRDGVEYGMPKQFRMRPGVYTLQAADGSHQSQFNAKPRTGPSFRMFLEPQSALFYFKIAGRKVPAYPVLRAMQVPDEQIKAAWGEDIFRANSTTKTSAHATSWINSTIQAQHLKAMRRAGLQIQDTTPEQEDTQKDD